MIVIVGLGAIGAGIGRRILECGSAVVGVDPAAGRRHAWQADTNRSAHAQLAEVPWSSVERIFVAVRMTEQAAAVLDQMRSLVAARHAPACHLLTTLEPRFADRLGNYADAPYRVLEQPVSGGEQGARSGRLTMMTAGQLTSGDDEWLRATVATELVAFDRYGQPTLAKLLNNVTGAYNVLALVQMLELAAEYGIDPVKFYRVVTQSSGASSMASMIFDLHGDLLAKDVALLRSEVGQLPSVAVGEDFLPSLEEARRLLGYCDRND